MKQLFGENAYGAKSGAAYSAAVCLYIFVSLIVSIVITSSGISGDVQSYLGYLCSPVAIVAALALCRLFYGTPIKEYAGVKCSPKYYLIAVLTIFGLLFAVSPLNSLFVYLLEMCGYQSQQSSLPSFEGWGMLGGLVVIALLPAVFEELLFRGVILGNAEKGTGTVASIFLSAFVFALYHGSVEQTIYQFICGCAFALLALRSGSILPSMLAHFLNNAVIIVLQGLSLIDEAGNVAMPQWAFILTCVLAAISLAAAAVWLILDKKPTAEAKKGEVKKFFLWGAAGIAVMALEWILGLFSL